MLLFPFSPIPSHIPIKIKKHKKVKISKVLSNAFDRKDQMKNSQIEVAIFNCDSDEEFSQIRF